MPTPCFWMEPTSRVQRSLSVDCSCGHRSTRHLPEVDVGDPNLRRDDNDRYGELASVDWDSIEWPTGCPGCGHEHDFETSYSQGGCLRSTSASQVYRRTDTGEEMALRDAPPGAMHDAFWMTHVTPGADGRRLTARLPNGHDWIIDSRASNCDGPDDGHHCWAREGEPPNVTVTKGAGCSEGGGSIKVGEAGQPGFYHGHLQGGAFTDSSPT